MRKVLLMLVVVACLGITDGNAKEISQEEQLKISFLKLEIGKMENEIASAEKKASRDTALIPTLIRTRIETDKLTVSILRQHVAALESGTEFTISAPATPPDPTLAASLETEIGETKLELEKTRKESAKYEGGLIKVTIDARAATYELTIASLQQRQLAAKYGLAIPAAPKETRQTAPRQAQKEQGTEGSASTAQAELDQEDIEKLKENQEVSVESAYFYKEGSLGILNGITVVVKNNTNQVVKEYFVGMLGYDKDGFPLKLGTSGVLKEGKGENCNIKPGSTHGKGSYFSLMTRSLGADQVKTVLACVSGATFYDGTTWENPYYKYWLEQFEDKPIPVPTPPTKTGQAKQTPGKSSGKK